MTTSRSTRASALGAYTPTHLTSDAVREIGGALNVLLADSLALYHKAKNFHCHVSGPNFRERHLLLDDQAGKVFAIIDGIAERVRKIGRTNLRSINQAAAMTRVPPNEADDVGPLDMLTGLLADSEAYVDALRATLGLCDRYKDVATASLIKMWIDDAEQRIWFLHETTRGARAGRH